MINLMALKYKSRGELLLFQFEQDDHDDHIDHL